MYFHFPYIDLVYIRFITKYSLLGCDNVNGIMFSTCSLLIHRKTVEFCTLSLYSAACLLVPEDFGGFFDIFYLDDHVIREQR